MRSDVEKKFFEKNCYEKLLEGGTEIVYRPSITLRTILSKIEVEESQIVSRKSLNATWFQRCL